MPNLTAISAKGLEKKQMFSDENINQLPQNWGHSNGKKQQDIEMNEVTCQWKWQHIFAFYIKQKCQMNMT